MVTGGVGKLRERSASLLFKTCTSVNAESSSERYTVVQSFRLFVM